MEQFLPFYVGFLLPSGGELWILLVLILILFGGKKIPELMRGVGKGVGELQKGLEEGKRSMEKAMQDEAAKPESTEQAETKTVAKE